MSLKRKMLSARISEKVLLALESIVTETQSTTCHVEQALREYKPIKSVLEKPKPKPPAKKAGDVIEVPAKVNHKAWSEWVEYRTKKTKPISRLAANKQFNLLMRYSFAQQQDIINQSIQNDYQGLFPPKGRQATTKTFQEEHCSSDWRAGL